MDSYFQDWAFVELMGHNKIAGHVTEYKFGNQSMIRIDVPQIDDMPKFSKIFNVSAVYAITPLSEQDATDYARKIKAKPLDVFDMNDIFQTKIKELVEKGTLLKPQLAESNEHYDDDDLPM
jgi:hypothetical protein